MKLSAIFVTRLSPRAVVIFHIKVNKITVASLAIIVAMLLHKTLRACISQCIANSKTI